eukprot:3342961-Pleurochrysis_carterae.AAC.1
MPFTLFGRRNWRLRRICRKRDRSVRGIRTEYALRIETFPDPAARRDYRPGASSAPAQLGKRPGRETAAAPVAAVRAEMGVCVTIPPRPHGDINICADGY